MQNPCFEFFLHSHYMSGSATKLFMGATLKVTMDILSNIHIAHSVATSSVTQDIFTSRISGTNTKTIHIKGDNQNQYNRSNR